MRQHKNQRNPILPLDIHIPDSEAHVMPDGKVYIYGSYDERDDVYCSERQFVVSSADMESWEISDEVLNGNDVPWFYDPDAPKYPGIDWSHPTPFILRMMAEVDDEMKEMFEKEDDGVKPALLFAPDCIHRDGKYYLYFCMSNDSEGVAVSESPNGPFQVVKQLPCGGIDPAIFIDEDGQAYYYWGQLFSHGVKMNPDMCSFDPEQIADNLVTEEEHFFHEGSSMRKIGDTYYYVYADMERGKPTSLGYSVSKSPMGPFQYKGIIIDNAECDPESWNNHGSIECINGQWYVFYHRCSRGTQLHRRLCIEKIKINPDGTIDEVKMTTQGIGEPMTRGEKIEGCRACGVFDGAYIDTVSPTDGSQEWLTAPVSGCSCIFRYVQSPDGFDSARIEGTGNALVEVYLDETQVGQAQIDGSGKITLQNLGSGEKTLKLVFKNPKDFHLLSVTLD